MQIYCISVQQNTKRSIAPAVLTTAELAATDANLPTDKTSEVDHSGAVGYSGCCDHVMLKRK